MYNEIQKRPGAKSYMGKVGFLVQEMREYLVIN